MHLSPLFILLFFAFAAHSQVQERVAILNTVDDSKPELDFTVLTYLTNSLREIAVKMLPENKYFVMTSQSIIEMLGPERKEECKNKCMLDMGKAISADYIGQARLGRLGGNLTITMELYHIRGNLIGSFNGNAKDEFGLVAVINEKAPAMFRKMLGVSSGPIIESGTYSVQTSGGDYEFAGEKRYLVNISSDPEGAGLSFNGLPLSNCKETPCKAELREGSVRIIANLEQYEIADTTVSIKQNNQSIRIRMKANFGVLEIKPVYSDGIGRDEQWGLSINGKTFSSFENRLSPNKYSVELSHRCYEDIIFEAGINKDKREVFDMASHTKLKKGGLVLNAERDGKPVSEVVYVNGVQVGETPFSGPVPLCAKVEIGSGRELVNVSLKHNDKVSHTVKSISYKSSASTAQANPAPVAFEQGYTAGTRQTRIVVYKFFDGKYRTGGFDYSYGGKSKVEIDKTQIYKSNASLKINLDPNDYSGSSISLYNEYFDFSKILLDGAVEFDIKGANGGEQAMFGFLDDDGKGKKTQSNLALNKYGQISKDWQHVKIPLADFPDRGMYWDNIKQIELPARINWDKISEFRISADKGTNPKGFQVWVANVEIVKGTVPIAKPKSKIVYWDEKAEIIEGLIDPAKLDGKAKALPGGVFYGGKMQGFGYVYGGLTAYKEQPTKTAGRNVLAAYMDDNEYSGVTFSLGEGKYIDLSKVRDKGGVYFWVKGKQGGEKVGFGIVDNQGGDIKSQTKVNLQDWVEGQTITKDWKLVKIPLKKFPDAGRAWDAKKQAEVVKNMQWNKIQEIRFSAGKGDNRRNGRQDDPVTIYLDQITFTENIDWVDPDLKWDSFKSNTPDLVLHDFENNPVFEPSTGPKSKIYFSIGKGNLDGKSLNISNYVLGDWVDLVYDFERQKAKKELTDWTKYWGIMFDIYTDKAWQGITVQVGDKGREIFVSSTGAPRGRNTVLVPFSSFTKFPYYQPPDAIQNGVLDLDGVKVLDIKPSGEGSEGSFQIDNVRLTNLHEAPRVKVPETANLTINGDLNRVINYNVSSAIFGINAALWDGDLLKYETKNYVRRINHGVVRYPGGLRADDDHWKKILEAKDWMVDTDEFLEWCNETGTTPMFTANFGTGTAEEAADWVKHTNITKKANVIYWEIGNEIYGDWHPQYAKYGADKGHTYGKRAREFIIAMKKVDPKIRVGVLGVIDGEWNENVLKYTADVADALIIHHYPQHFGEENDFGLLASPQDLGKIFGRVRESIKKFSPKKDIEIWLTEWNSVDFNPGPQSISLVNGLFVADYLGMLAKVGAGSAQYWDIHNEITQYGGDYGYLSRSYEEIIGGNKPRPSYYAFQMASDGIRGKLVESNSGSTDLTTYLSVNGKKKTLLAINKSPYTAFNGTIKIPGFAGKAKVEVLAAPKGQAANKVIKIDPPRASNQDIKEGSVLTFPAHSITLITIE